MTREIKFRAYYVPEKYMMDWKEFEYQLNENNYISPFKSTDNWKVMQYTGLEDKNGVEIYEGDVLTELGHVKVVEWSDKGLGWVSTIVKEYKNNYSASIEILGNIYENPELLKETGN
jgi:uncharacterized phage protein (TIGR01671 family)